MHGRAEKLRMQFFDQPQEALLPKTRFRVRLPGHGKIAARPCSLGIKPACRNKRPCPDEQLYYIYTSVNL
jgi:hypothetical protein